MPPEEVLNPASFFKDRVFWVQVTMASVFSVAFVVFVSRRCVGGGGGEHETTRRGSWR